MGNERCSCETEEGRYRHTFTPAEAGTEIDHKQELCSAVYNWQDGSVNHCEWQEVYETEFGHGD